MEMKILHDPINDTRLFPSMEVDEEYNEPNETKSFNSILSFAVGNSNPRLTGHQRDLIKLSNGDIEVLGMFLFNSWVNNVEGIEELFFQATSKDKIDFSNMDDCVTTAEYLMKIKA